MTCCTASVMLIDIAAWENYRGDPLPYPSGPYSELLKEPVNGSWYNHHRSLGAELMHRYIVVRPHIKSVVEEFARLHFSGFVVGVHVRSTDKARPSSAVQCCPVLWSSSP